MLMQVPVAMTLPTPYLWQREVYAAWTWLIQSTPCLLLLTAHLPLGEAYRPHLPLPCGLLSACLFRVDDRLQLPSDRSCAQLATDGDW